MGLELSQIRGGPEKKATLYMVLQCSKLVDKGSFLEMTIEIGSIRSVLKEVVRNRTKFEKIEGSGTIV